MLRPLTEIVRDPALRLSTLLLVLNGAIGASLAPYQSLLAIRLFGLTDRTYALVLVAGAAVFVVASLVLGILSDLHFARRSVALATATAPIGGFGLMTALPGPHAFVLVHAVLLPIGATLFAQCFALARVAANRLRAEGQAAQMAAVRAAFALPWVVVLPLWSLAYRAGVGLQWIYPVLLSLAGLTAAVIAFGWPKTDEADRGAAGAGSLLSGLAEVLRPEILLRVLLLGATISAVALYMVLLGLVMSAAGRPAGDVAIYAGVMAGIEVPLMLALPALQQRVGAAALVAAGAGLYALHLVGLPFLAGTPFVWALTLPGAAGGAAILAVPIAYLQDLMKGSPGAGSSLMALQRVTGDALCALAFATGTAVAGYRLAALIGAFLSVGAGLVLWRIDRLRFSASRRSR